MRTLQKAISDGQEVSDAEMSKMVKFAVAMRDGSESSPRDRLRACELLDSIIGRGVNVALALEKIDADEEKQSKQTSVNVNVGVGVKIISGVDPESV